jgi:cell division protein FtsN
MKAERGVDDSTRELRLEGVGLVVVGGVLLAAICGAYYLGKWVESREHPNPILADAGEGPLSQVVRSNAVESATEDTSFFDEIDGTAAESEPEREARPAPARAVNPPDEKKTPETKPAAGPTKKPTDPGGTGDFWVQVFAGRDRSSAESLVGKLKSDGYVVKVFSEREGQGLLFKVRVGGYPSKDRAQKIASLLKESGYSAWVPPVE